MSHVKIPKNVNVAALAAVDSEDSTILSLHTNTDGPVVASNSANGTQDKTVATNDASNEHHTRPDPTNKPGLTNRPGSTNSMQDTSEATLSDLLNRLIARQEQSQRDSEKHNSALITAVNTMNAHLATISKQLSNVDNETVEAAQHAHVLKELLEAVRTMHKNDNRSVDSTRREVEGEISVSNPWLLDSVLSLQPSRWPTPTPPLTPARPQLLVSANNKEPRAYPH